MSDQQGQQPADAASSGPGQQTDPRPGLTLSLRAGLGDNRVSVGTDGLVLSLPADVDPFEYFSSAPTAPAAESSLQRQDMADAQAADSAGGPVSIDEMRVARMVQMMVVFGRSSGEAELRNRERESRSFEYFA